MQFLENNQDERDVITICSILADRLSLGNTQLYDQDIEKIQDWMVTNEPIDWQKVHDYLPVYLKRAFMRLYGFSPEDPPDELWKVTQMAERTFNAAGVAMIAELKKRLKHTARTELSTDDLYSMLGGKPAKRAKLDSEGGFSDE